MGKFLVFGKTYAQKNNNTWSAKELIIDVLPTQDGVLTYNGSEQFPVWKNLDLSKVTVEGETSAVDAGVHYITVTPKDNYRWSNKTQDAVQVPYTVKRKPIVLPTQKGSLIFNNKNQSPQWNNYNSAELSQSGTTAAKNVGKYETTFTPSKNHCWTDGTFDGRKAAWSIEILKLPKVTLASKNYDYTGSNVYPTISNYNGSYMTQSGDTYGKELGNYSVTVKLISTTNTCWDDNSTTDISLAYSIVKAKITIPTLPKTDYNVGETITIPTSPYYTISGDYPVKTEPGTYVITLSLNDPTHYTWSDGTTTNKTITYKIGKTSVTVPSIKVNPTYDGSTIDVSSSSYWNNFDTSLMTIGGTTSAKNPGTYTATFALKDTSKNQWADGTTAAKSVQWQVQSVNQYVKDVQWTGTKNPTGSTAEYWSTPKHNSWQEYKGETGRREWHWRFTIKGDRTATLSGTSAWLHKDGSADPSEKTPGLGGVTCNWHTHQSIEETKYDSANDTTTFTMVISGVPMTGDSHYYNCRGWLDVNVAADDKNNLPPCTITFIADSVNKASWRYIDE